MICSPHNFKWVKDSIRYASSVIQATAKSDLIIIILHVTFINKHTTNPLNTIYPYTLEIHVTNGSLKRYTH